MTFNAQMFGRVIRGVAGLAMVVMGIIYNNWAGIIGLFLLLSAGGGCGLGSSSCSVRSEDQ